MDEILARLKGFATQNAKKKRSELTVVTPEEVDAAEAALGFALPPLLRALYIEIGYGSWGLNGSLMEQPGWPEFHHWLRKELDIPPELEGLLPVWPDQLVPY